jgi:hypothetical protein
MGAADDSERSPPRFRASEFRKNKSSRKNTRRPPERLRVCRCVVCINKTTKNNVFKENLLPFNHRNGMPISLSWAQSYNGGVSTQYSTKKPRASASSKAPRMRMPLLAAYWLLHESENIGVCPSNSSPQAGCQMAADNAPFAGPKQQPTDQVMSFSSATALSRLMRVAK